jgi:hypothetical protein
LERVTGIEPALSTGRLMTTVDVGARPMARRPQAGQHGVCRVSGKLAAGWCPGYGL